MMALNLGGITWAESSVSKVERDTGRGKEDGEAPFWS